MSIYQENKLFINKFKRVLDVSVSKSRGSSTSLSLYFNNIPGFSINTIINLDVMPVSVVINETPKRLYFGVKLKETSRDLGVGYTKYKSPQELAPVVFTNSLSKFYTTAAEKADIQKFLKSKGISKTSQGVNIGEENLIPAVQSDPSVLLGYDKVNMVENNLSDILSASINIYLHPDVLKSLKNRDMIPVAYITDEGDLCYLTKHASSRKSTSMFENVSLSGVVDAPTLKRIAHRCLECLPYRYWVVYDIDTNTIDKKYYMSYNFDI